MRKSKRVGSLYAHRSSTRRLRTGKLPLSKPLLTGVMVFIFAFFAAFSASSILAPTNSSDATDNTNTSSSNYYTQLKTQDVSMNLKTNPAGTMTVVSSTTKAATNAPYGYKLYVGISATKTSGALKPAADQQKNGLYLEGDLSRTDGAIFDAVSGTGGESGTPTALTDNTWGYAVDKDTIGTPTIWTTENHTTMTSAPPTNDKFAAMPTVGNEELIQETTSGNVSPTTTADELVDSDFTEATLYYGIRGTPAKPNGIYTNTIAYTAIPKGEPTSDITFSPTSYTRDATYESMVWDDTLTITTPVYTSAQDLGTATVTLTGGPTGISSSSPLTCSNPTLTTVNNLLTVSCTLPQAYAGNYKVTLNLAKYGQTYTADYTYNATWDTISAMQEMTSTICAEPQTPNTDAASSSTTLPAAQFDGTVVPEKFLTDLRGGGGHINPTTGAYQEAYTGKYRIRKLADGNCWMTENMDLPQNDATTFYSYDTNLTAIPDSTITESGAYGTYTDTDGIISWTPKNVVDTSTCTTGAADCSPNTTGPATSNSWCYNNNGAPIDANVKNAHNYQGPGCTEGSPGTLSTKYIDDNDGNRQGIGTYYNWAAATAQSGGDTAGTNAINSVCPKGWKLPTGEGVSTGNKSFATLMNTYGYADDSTGSAAARKAPLSLVYSGSYGWGGGYLNGQGIYGYWWSSSPSTSASSAYFLYVYSSRLIPQNGSNKAYGFPLRCVQN